MQRKRRTDEKNKKLKILIADYINCIFNIFSHVTLNIKKMLTFRKNLNVYVTGM